MIAKYKNILETLDHIAAVFDMLCFQKSSQEDTKRIIKEFNSLLPEIVTDGYYSTLYCNTNAYWLSVTSKSHDFSKITLRFGEDISNADGLNYEWEITFKDGIDYDA